MESLKGKRSFGTKLWVILSGFSSGWVFYSCDQPSIRCSVQDQPILGVVGYAGWIYTLQALCAENQICAFPCSADMDSGYPCRTPLEGCDYLAEHVYCIAPVPRNAGLWEKLAREPIDHWITWDTLCEIHSLFCFRTLRATAGFQEHVFPGSISGLEQILTFLDTLGKIAGKETRARLLSSQIQECWNAILSLNLPERIGRIVRAIGVFPGSSSLLYPLTSWEKKLLYLAGIQDLTDSLPGGLSGEGFLLLNPDILITGKGQKSILTSILSPYRMDIPIYEISPNRLVSPYFGEEWVRIVQTIVLPRFPEWKEDIETDIETIEEVCRIPACPAEK